MQNTIERLRAEFLEMPGLRLTLTQIHRFCGLERSLCSDALETLVKERFLCANADGTYARLTEGDITRPRPAKVHLDTTELRRQAS
jgi:DNA-binding IclR family transcriptional regulator